MQIADTILGVELYTNVPSEACCPTIESAPVKEKLVDALVLPCALLVKENIRLDASHIWHDFELGVQRRAALSTEEVLVDLPRISFDIPGFRRARGDLKVGSWNDSIGSIGSTGPFLTICAMAERWDN